MAIELADAYVAVIPSLKGASEKIKEQLSGVDVSEPGEKMGNSLGKSISSGVSIAGKAIITTIGAIGGALGSLAATGGMSRALNIQQAQTMFKGLKLEWEDYRETIEAAVTGTAFGMDQAALVASGLAASGVKAGVQMEHALNGAVGAAATFGADLGDIGGIFQKVAAQGKVTGDNLFQMSARGINGLSILSEYLGKSQEEISKMVSSGKIDFQTFSDAMYSAFGESAKGANDTFTGSLTNMRAALSRFGQVFATPLVENAPKLFVQVKDAINALTYAVTPFAEAFGAKLTSAIEKVSGVIKPFNDRVDELKKKVADGSEKLGNAELVLRALNDTFTPIQIKVGAVVAGIAALGAAFGALSAATAAIPGLASISGLLGGLAGGGGILGLASNGLKAITSPLGIVGAAAVAVAVAFGHLMATDDKFSRQIKVTVGNIVNGLKPAFESLQGIVPIVQVVWENFVEIVRQLAPSILRVIAAITPLVSTLISSVIPVISTIASSVSSLATIIASQLDPIIRMIAQLIEAVMPQIQETITTVMNLISDVINTVWPYIQTIITSAMQVIQKIMVEIWPHVADIINQAMALIQEIIETVWPIIQEIITAVMDFIVPIIVTGMENILNTIQTVWPFIQTIIEAVMNGIQAVIKIVTGIINGDWEAVWGGIRDYVSAVWNTITSLISGAVSIIQGAIQNALSFVSSIWNSIWSAVSNFVASTWENVKTTVSNGISGMMDFISSIPDRIMSFFSDASTWLLDAGRSIIDGLVNGIKGAIDGAVNAVGNAVGAIRDLFPFSPAKKGPFSGKGWVLYSGISIMKAIGEGVELQAASTMRTLGSIMGDMQDMFTVNIPYAMPAMAVPEYAGSIEAARPTSNVNQSFYIESDDPNKVAAVVAARQRQYMR